MKKYLLLSTILLIGCSNVTKLECNRSDWKESKESIIITCFSPIFIINCDNSTFSMIDDIIKCRNKAESFQINMNEFKIQRECLNKKGLNAELEKKSTDCVCKTNSIEHEGICILKDEYCKTINNSNSKWSYAEEKCIH